MALNFLLRLEDASIRSAIVALIVALALWLFKKRISAAVAHAVWTSVLAGMLVLLALGHALPLVPIPVSMPASIAVAALPLPPVRVVPAPAPFPGDVIITHAQAPSRLSWPTTMLLLYGAGALLLLTRLFTGWLVVRKLATHSKPSGLPGVYESEAVVVPLTIGWIKPKILLPSEWRQWKTRKLEAVMAHERSHVRRRDSLIALGAALNRCLFWFHPLAWWIERKLKLLAEQACDEHCVALTFGRREYARLLLEMAGMLQNTRERVYRHALGMASSVRQRIDRVLDEKMCLSPNMTPARWLLLAGTTVPLIYGAGAVQLEQQRALSRSEFPRFIAPPAPNLLAQQPPVRPVPPPALTPVADQAVVINVEVFEPLGRYVTGLEEANFRVFEDDVEQTITGFSSALTPISLGVVVNVHSGALQNPQQANAEFSRELLPEDELFVSYPVGPGVPLFDAVYNAMTQLERAKNQRKILYVVSDQADLASRYTAAGLSQALKDSAVQVFAAVGTDQPDGATLREIAEATGGRYFVGIFSPDGRFLAELNDGRRELGSLGSIFRIGGLGAARVGSYALTYTPTNPARDGGFRRIRVDATGVGLPLLTAHTRSGYFAPTR